MTTLNLKLMYTLFAAIFCAFAFTIPKPVHFDKMEHNFGIITQGIPQTAVFTLTNESDQAIILKNVKGSCGCTATSYTSETILSGESTEIEATFNAKAMGAFRKTVSVYTNAQEEAFVLTITGTVAEAK
ncbi:MAG: DUF1573 domain-containing protein [Saprospiraceae bacterium]|nr:DUF1573 domain-containing protein [Saprospiraceae bacterium]